MAKVTFSRLSEKEKGQCQEIFFYRKSLHQNQTLAHSAKETVFLGIKEHSSHLAGPTTSTIDEWLVDSGALSHIAYDKAIWHYVKPSSSQISIGDASSI